jgi:hypothetical protein
MSEERIKVRVTTTGQTLDVVVLSRRADAIEVVLGEGVHSVRCRLTPTRTEWPMPEMRWAAKSCNERARGEVAAELERLNAAAGKFKRS